MVLVVIGTTLIATLGLAAAVTNLSATVGPWQQSAKITPDDAHEEGAWGQPSHLYVRFGTSVAIDGDTMAVGTGMAINSQTDWIYVFERDGEDWDQVAKLIPPNQTHASNFGISVDIDEQAGLLVAGDDGEPETGSVYVYERTAAGEWDLLVDGIGPENDSEPHNQYGRNVAVSGTTIAVSDYRSADTGFVSGAVYVYDLEGSSLVQRQAITSPNAEPSGGFGFSLALDDDRMLVGATAEGTWSEGSAYVYQGTGDKWLLESALKAPDPETNEQHGGRCFGISVDLDDEDLVVGDACWTSPADFHGPTYGTGKGYVFTNEDGWELDAELQSLESTPATRFGFSVGIDDGIAVLGAIYAPGGTDPAMLRAGAAYVFTETGDAWLQEARLIGNDTVRHDFFGWAVGISGETIVVGAVDDDNRHDGTPPPLNNFSRFPPTRALGVSVCIDSPPSPYECSLGRGSGSAYVFEPIPNGSRSWDSLKAP